MSYITIWQIKYLFYIVFIIFCLYMGLENFWVVKGLVNIWNNVALVVRVTGLWVCLLLWGCAGHDAPQPDSQLWKFFGLAQVWNKVCRAWGHTHSSSGTSNVSLPQGQAIAMKIAIHDWQEWGPLSTFPEYGPLYTWEAANNKLVECHTDNWWITCNITATPCRYGSMDDGNS